jgi:hypothetical protein
MKSALGVIGVLAVVGVVALGGRTARATSQTSCTVTQVAWSEVNGGTAEIFCGGGWFYATASNGACSISPNGQKAWMSLAQTALLSGKQVTLQYDTTTCGAGPNLTWVDLIQ